MFRSLFTAVALILTIHCVSAKGNKEFSYTRSSSSECVCNDTHSLISRNLFVEFGGRNLGIGIGYDQRFTSTTVFGFSSGLAFTNGSVDNGGWWGAYDGTYTDVDFTGVTIPLEVNAILGKRASKFELGVGGTPCILNRSEAKYNVWVLENDRVKESVKLNIFGTLSIGYRLQRKSGFFLRAGITFMIGDIKCSPIDGLILLPTLSLGYTL